MEKLEKKVGEISETKKRENKILGADVYEGLKLLSIKPYRGGTGVMYWM